MSGEAETYHEEDIALFGHSSSPSETQQNKPKPIVSIFRRDSESSFAEVEGEGNFKSRERSKFTAFRRSSTSSQQDQEEERHSGDSSTLRNSIGHKGSSQELTKSRKTSLLLENDSCYVRKTACQLVRCENYFRMDPSCYTDTKQKYCGLIPCLIALGGIIIIILPLVKILGGLRSDIDQIHCQMRGIQKGDGDDMAMTAESGSSRSQMQNELDNFYTDRTGRTDFALESAGGRIEKTIHAKNYGGSYGIFGIPLCEGTNGPRAMIQPTSAPGECWAFHGSSAAVLIKLLGKVKIDSVSLEHISKKISPTGKLDTAPKEFIVYGQKTKSSEKVLLGEFEYKLDSSQIQFFPVKSSNEAFEYVQLHIKSNHGSSEYTCVYRFRVHGTLDTL